MALTVNGRSVSLRVDPSRSLLDVLRNELGLKASRYGCGAGLCGACMVMVDGHAVPACDTPMWSAAGKDVVTVEGLGDERGPHPVQRAFIAEQAAQCGYCTSGMMIAAVALLRRCPHPTEAQARAGLERNLCRCGAHPRVLRAVARAAEEAAPGSGRA
ncbi:(2Fe-2S)-binding protein [Achromobacter aloeverae]|uniref:(2Fe-2S)-binding protein n=2 Tax=Achromobacter aloeverae TaxID=1750518 RepID=A0A4V1MS46_9BURK|nr:(2Fe-2S)-binding protein [Achromobacter aloeverae]RXN88210.1 (2Fe-2S)-binding protein [Achromobacter aloeverae]